MKLEEIQELLNPDEWEVVADAIRNMAYDLSDGGNDEEVALLKSAYMKLFNKKVHI